MRCAEARKLTITRRAGKGVSDAYVRETAACVRGRPLFRAVWGSRNRSGPATTRHCLGQPSRVSHGHAAWPKVERAVDINSGCSCRVRSCRTRQCSASRARRRAESCPSSGSRDLRLPQGQHVQPEDPAEHLGVCLRSKSSRLRDSSSHLEWPSRDTYRRPVRLRPRVARRHATDLRD